ncbi:MAG: GNAT family N-acetyltransferase [Desulfobacteraceae bacterium]|nr:GNAT family N-acetyltransferase [Desulfobacteraceae bacterium]
MKLLKTKRLRLKQIIEENYDFIRFYLSDPERTRFLPLEKPYPEEKAKEWFLNRILHWEKNHFGSFVIQERESEKIIGYCGLEYVGESDFIDIRYGLIQEVWGKGYAFEVASCCLEYGFETLGLKTIYGAVVPENYSSIHILKKIGMKPDSNFNCYGTIVDSYSISRNDFSTKTTVKTLNNQTCFDD